MVFYRKYRPQNISQLDSSEVREKLTSVLSGKSNFHAFLFTGPKGLGKTSAARIVAKIVNCENRNQESGIRNQAKNKKNTLKQNHNSSFIIPNSNVEPCNKCDQCVSITDGTNLDVLEIDGASNRGIDEVRDLREKIRLSPVSARKKVYIIDEVHMLTTEAFNALLKTLEEPPAHALFILCTTEPHKVPATIASRCLHIAFKKATLEDLTSSFSRIAKGEKLNIEKEALLEIAKLSDGSFRDGAKILEEMVLLAGKKKITKEFVQEKYHVSGIMYYASNMIENLSKKDAKASLQLVVKMVEEGIDIKYFIEQLIQALHQDLLAKVGIKNESRIKNQELRIEDIKKLVELLTRAHAELKYAVLPQLPLEIAIIEWSMDSENSDKSGARGPAPTFPPASARSGLTSSAALRAVESPSSRVTPRSSSDIFQQLIDGVKQHNHSLAGVLRGCVVSEYDGKKLLIEAKYKFHKEKLEEEKAMEILEKVAEGIVGKKVKVSVVLKEK